MRGVLFNLAGYTGEVVAFNELEKRAAESSHPSGGTACNIMGQYGPRSPGHGGNIGVFGNVESVIYRSCYQSPGSNLTLTARINPTT
jgi:hypothetical protein